MEQDIGFLTGIIGVVSAIGGAGGAWGAAAHRIKVAERDLAQVRVELSEHEKNTRAMGERLARMEGKLDLIVTHLNT